MLLEALEWLVTPCPWTARWDGSLARQIAIRHRHHRCRAAWTDHLARSRSQVQKCQNRLAGGLMVVFGSGHLNDVPAPPSGFRAVLVDLVHPVEIQIAAACSGGRLALETADVFEPPSRLQSVIAAADLCVSAGLLSQLALDPRSGAGPGTAALHWKLLSSARHSLLITDVAARSHSGEAWDPLFDSSALPNPCAEWIWPLIPDGESPQGPQERLVRAFQQ